MAWSAATFKAEYTEFSATADAIVTAKIAAATRRTSTGFGARRDDAIGLLTAHLLATAPGGMTARVDSEEGKAAETTYMTELKKMRAEVFGGPWSVGQGNGGMIA